VLKAVKASNPDMYVIIFTAYSSVDSAIIALNDGAFAYLQKPLNLNELKLTLERALKMQSLTFENRKLLREFKEFSLIDPQTGLYNYRYLKLRLAQELTRSKRYAQPISLIMMDIDYFKSINDAYGHPFGDFILHSLAQFILKFTRGSDVVVRLGGEEFVLLMLDAHKEGALLFARRLLEKINSYVFDEKGHKITLKISMGIASFPEDPMTDTENGLISLADKVLSYAKEAGGNRIYTSQDVHQKEIKTEKSKGHQESVEKLKNKLLKMTQRINNSLVESVYAFTKTVDARDSYAGDHSKKVILLATRLGKKLKVSSKDIEDLEHAAVLHDLGKIGVPDNILHKKKKLTSKEIKEMQNHPKIGAEIIRPVHTLRGVVPIILYHHERYDGKGYCAGLKGDKIPLGARILSVVDVYQALISDRPFRKAYSKQKSLAIIKRGRGSQFDPHVVDAFMEIIKDPAL
jgi:diguanylate cyclase (GGDEF)-like protein